ncbi:DnaJ family domain-containing protein [Oceanobacillus chungangensis]|uniref:DUF1992 domain-containing protein n=1 Tax=Oceanobacillus chungangensis TaxID=1229152 RepID=A0A3D8PJC6_9BACI|nr:DnaJ family domain-containing protein [Oceanobacillus chungangensis]RDW16193.1 DUF1992 domain-containing protein [Oceanobacillus chungangensis]
MYIFVEEKIKKAVDNGEFDNLPGNGKPLNLKDDLAGISPELRMGYKILKNAGYIDEETASTKDKLTFNDLMTSATGTADIDINEKRTQYEAFVQSKRLHTNPSFRKYARKIMKNLFG